MNKLIIGQRVITRFKEGDANDFFRDKFNDKFAAIKSKNAGIYELLVDGESKTWWFLREHFAPINDRCIFYNNLEGV